MDQTVVIDVQINGYQELVKSLEATAALKKQRADLDKQLKEGVVSQEQYTEALAENLKQTDEARLKETELRNSLKQTTKERTAATGSLNQMRAELSRLKKSYNDLSKADREAAAGNELRDKIKNLNDEIGNIEQGTGDFRRNVGNYANSIRDALGSALPGFSQLSAQFDVAKQGFGTLKGAIGPATAGMNAFGKALVATPIGAVALALVGLITYLTRFDGALDGIEQTLGGVQAAIAPVIKWLGLLGKNIMEVLGAAGEVIGKLGTALARLAKGDLEGARKAFNEAGTAIDKVKTAAQNAIPATDGLAASMGKAYDAGVRLVKMTQDLEDAEADLAFNQVKFAKQIEQAEKRAADKTLSLKERMDAMNEAKRLSLQISAEEDKVAESRAKKIVQEVLNQQALGDRINENTKITTEYISKLREEMVAMADRGELDGDRNKVVAQLTEALKQQQEAEQSARDIELKYAAESSKIRKQLLAERKEQADAARKQADERIAQMRRIADLEAQTATDEVDKMRKQQKVLAMQLEQDQKAAKSKEERLLLAKKYEQDLANLETEYQNKRAAAAADAERQRQEFAASVEGQELARLNEFQRQRLAAIEQAQADGAISKQTADAARLEAEAMHLEALLAYQQKYGKDTLDVQSQINKAKIRDAEATAQKEAAIQRANVEVARNVVNSMGSVLSVLSANESANAEFQKVMALANIAISTAESIAGIVRIASTTSPDPITFGVQLTAGIATVLANIANAASIINSTNAPAAPAPQRAARGGMIGGNLHMNGGTLIEAERGEAIMTRAAVGQFGPLLDQINQLSGGASITGQSAAQQTTAAALAHDQLANSIGGMTVNVRDDARVRRQNVQPKEVARF